MRLLIVKLVALSNEIFIEGEIRLSRVGDGVGSIIILDHLYVSVDGDSDDSLSDSNEFSTGFGPVDVPDEHGTVALVDAELIELRFDGFMVLGEVSLQSLQLTGFIKVQLQLALVR
jgi:hypothetical protein